MATVRPHLAPPHPPPPPPASAAAVPQSPYARSCGTAAGAHGRKESVAESCCAPTSSEAVAVADADDSCSDGDYEDGCESCVDGSEGSAGRHEEGMISEVVWSWSQDSTGGCFIWPPNRRRTTTSCGHAGDESGGGDDDDDDPKAAAARRQEDDRKFWETCLASGYP